MSRTSLWGWAICLLLVAEVTIPRAAMKETHDHRLLVRADAKYRNIVIGTTSSLVQAKQDTVYLLGGPHRDDGDFQNSSGAPSLDGWTGHDLTQRTESHWQREIYNDNTTPCLDPYTFPNHAWWCGAWTYPSCGGGDPEGGYGNDWLEYLDWWGEVTPPFDPYLPLDVTVEAQLSHDTEPGYDFLSLQFEDYTGIQDFGTPGLYSGKAVCIPVNEIQADLTPIDRPGFPGKWMHLRWRFFSDGSGSDEDCVWPGEGAVQLDEIRVSFQQGGTGPYQIGPTETCEPYNPPIWDVDFPPNVGDFSQIWPLLDDIDPCTRNVSPQLAFIDDGIVVPGTGGYLGNTWIYGPNGWVVNPEGGMAGPDFHLHNELWSPVIEWPVGAYDGAQLCFDVYRHENLGPGSAGIMYTWRVRSTASGDPQDIDDAFWRDHQFGYFGGPGYLRHHEVVSDLLQPDRTHVQVALGVRELGWAWGLEGIDASPAPYFDNVAVAAFMVTGPTLSAREVDLAQDSYPEIGTIDYGNLAANHVRFD
ncbi:MAG: hypothetical protein ABIF77_18360, partial [bacterium]